MWYRKYILLLTFFNTTLLLLDSIRLLKHNSFYHIAFWKNCWDEQTDGNNLYMMKDLSLNVQIVNTGYNFLKNYRSADVIPKWSNFRIPNNGCFEPTTVHNFQRKSLKEELFQAKKALVEYELKVLEKKNIIKSVLPSSVLLFKRVTLFNTRKNVEVTYTKNWKICRKNKGVYCLIYIILLNCSNLIFCHQNMY